MLPLLLGILGIIYNYRKNQQVLSVLLMFFIFTGIGIVFYLNSPPVEPRERDYIYVGSFYVFGIWIALGVMAMMEFLGKLLKHRIAGVVTATLLCFSVPAIVGSQNVIFLLILQKISFLPVPLMQSCLRAEIMILFLYGMPRKWRDTAPM